MKAAYCGVSDYSDNPDDKQLIPASLSPAFIATTTEWFV